MNLITISFELLEEKQIEFVKAFENIVDFWKEQGFTVSLFRETSNKNHFFLLLLTENTVDDLTLLIQNHPEIRDFLRRVKDSECRVVVSYLEQIM